MEEINELRKQLKAAEDCRSALVEQKQRLEDYKTGPPIPPPPPTAFEALDPCATRKQHRMKVFLQQLGVVGLWHAIYTNARQAEYEEMNDRANNGEVNASWQVLMDDYEILGPESRTLYYLLSTPEEVLLALIEGNLPSKMQDDKFKSKYASFLSLQADQGVYVCYIGVAHQDTPSQSAPATGLPETGRGLNLGELKDVVDTMTTYCKNEKATYPSDPDQAQRIDTRYRCASTARKLAEYKDGYRRYSSGSGENQFNRIINFIWASSDIYDLDVNGIDPSLSQLRLQRCFCYVGLGSKVLDRAVQHQVHTPNETPVWGLFTATCKALFGTRFSIADFTYQIIHTVRREDIGLDEILVSVLASAYAFDGGLSAVHAGKHKGAKATRDDTYDEELEASFDMYQNRGCMAKNVDQSLQRYADTKQVIAFRKDNWLQRQQVEADLGALKTKVDAAIEHYGDLVAHLKLQILKKATEALNA